LPGIYRTDLLKLIGKERPSTPEIDGLLLSHILLDHSGLISLLDERIPITCSEMSSAYAKAPLDVGTRGLETEICNFKRRPLSIMVVNGSRNMTVKLTGGWRFSAFGELVTWKSYYDVT
jgi:glyoxylase-like metal-dependent hydrolase (beta-lactamase superfamily II)